MNKVALYTRVSTEDQARDGSSLEVQREFLEKYAREMKWEVYYPEPGKIYMDDGISGYSLDRPAFRRLMVDAKKKRFNCVLVHKIDRFSRKLQDALNVVEELKDLGIAFKSATEFFDTTTSSGKLMFQQLGSFAEFERNRIKERVFPGMVKGIQRGNWQGSRYSPYGYYYNKTTKLLEVVPDEAQIVKTIFFMYGSGQSTTQIAGYLFKKGYKTRSGGLFHTKLVNDILRSKIYIGLLVWNVYHYDKSLKTLKGHRYVKNDPSKVIVGQGKHESIITQGDYDAVQLRLDQYRRGFQNRAGSEDYPLSGILYCGTCGHRMQGALLTASREKKKTKAKRRYYRCCGRATHYVECKNPAIWSEKAESVVFTIVKTLLRDDLCEARFQNLLKNTYKSYNKDVEKEMEGKQRILKENLLKQEKLLGVYTEGLVAKEAYVKQVMPLRSDEKQIRDELTRLKVSLIEREKSKNYKDLLRSVVNHFDLSSKDAIDPMGRKGLLRLLFRRVDVVNGQITKFELYEPFKSLYEGMELKWQPQTELKTDQQVTAKNESVCCCAPSDGHWPRVYTRLCHILFKLYP